MASKDVAEATALLETASITEHTTTSYEAVPDSEIVETPDTTEHCKPSQVKHKFGVIYIKETADTKIFGKWLVFRSYDDIDETWEKVRRAIAEDKLQGCVCAKCSTMKYNPTEEGPGPSTATVISVYTEEHNIDDIGLKLVELVKHDISYKTNEATRKYQYAHTGRGRVTVRTIYWNDGKPAEKCKNKRCHGPRYNDLEDKWHRNKVYGPMPFRSQEVYGWWVVELEYLDLTRLWHLLKNIIESEEKNFGIIKMICPPKCDSKSATEKPVFRVYTNSDNKDSVGKKLSKIIKDNINTKQDLHGDKQMYYEEKPKGNAVTKNKRAFSYQGQ